MEHSRTQRPHDESKNWNRLAGGSLSHNYPWETRVLYTKLSRNSAGAALKVYKFPQKPFWEHLAGLSKCAFKSFKACSDVLPTLQVHACELSALPCGTNLPRAA